MENPKLSQDNKSIVDEEQHLYDQYYSSSVFKIQEFYLEIGKRLMWQKEFTQVLDNSDTNFPKWFAGGKINACYNCLDVQIQRGYGQQLAFECYSALTNTIVSCTYQSLLDKAQKISSYLISEFHLQKEDIILVLLPSILEDIYIEMAAARIGVLFHCVPSSYSSEVLHEKIKFLKPAMIVTTNLAYQGDKEVDLTDIIDKSLQGIQFEGKKVCVDRQAPKKMKENWINFSNLYEHEKPEVECVFVDPSYPLFLLGTSGSTGLPKLVQYSHVSLLIESQIHSVMWGLQPGNKSLIFNSPGGITIELLGIFGCLARAGTTILAELKQLTSDLQIYWKLIDKFKCQFVFFLPNWLEIVTKNDPEGKLLSKYDISSLKIIVIGGEMFTHHLFEWCKKFIHPDICVTNGAASTETCVLFSNYRNKELFGDSFPSATMTLYKPLPGKKICILDNEGNEVLDPNKIGRLAIKKPLTPNMMSTLFKDQIRYLESYLSIPNYFLIGDQGYFDENGFFFHQGRADDLIKINSTTRFYVSEIELAMKEMIECVDEIYISSRFSETGGLDAVAFVVLKNDQDQDQCTQKVKLAGLQITKNTIGIKEVRYYQNIPRGHTGKVDRAWMKKENEFD